jgi:hypothetical protein
MSLGIVFKGAEGIVLAADSRVTLMAQVIQQPPQQQPPQQPALVPATYDNATKLLKINGQDFVGAVTYGVGAIGQQQPRTAHSYIPEFETELANTGRLSVHNFATRLSAFFMQRWQDQMPPNFQGPGMVFLIGGYDEGANVAYGRVFELEIPFRPTPVERHAGSGEFGMTWGGQREYADRLITGFDDNLPIIIQQFLNLTDDQRAALRDHLRGRSQVPVPFPFLPLQDCVDLSIFLIRTTISIQNWIVGIRGVGGAIDVATITRTDGFSPIQTKSIVGEQRITRTEGLSPIQRRSIVGE